jgi:hypothetical protein
MSLANHTPYIVSKDLEIDLFDSLNRSVYALRYFFSSSLAPFRGILTLKKGKTEAPGPERKRSPGKPGQAPEGPETPKFFFFHCFFFTFLLYYISVL